MEEELLKRNWYAGGFYFGKKDMRPVFFRQDNEIFAIGWGHIQNLKQYETQEEVKQALEKVTPGLAKQSYTWNAKTIFCMKQLKKGDILVLETTNQSSDFHIYAWGEVLEDFEQGYQLMPNLGHTVRIKWRAKYHKPIRMNKEKAKQIQVSKITSALDPVSEEQKKAILEEIQARKQEREKEIENMSEYYGNFIYYGAPGSGKSYQVNKIVNNPEIFDETRRILFYPEYSYSDFVGQVLPTVEEKETGKEITYQFVPGPFTKILAEALENPERMYCLVIEEINRGNAASIFGDIFQLLDRKKKNAKDQAGDSEYPIQNDLIVDWMVQTKGEAIREKLTMQNEITLPKNLSIYATMNSSDQNVFVLDTAFKRRWKFQYVPIDFENVDNPKYLVTARIPGKTKILWKDFVQKLNEKIPELNGGMNGDDKQIGQFFVTEDELKNEDEFAQKIFLYLWEDVAKNAKDQLFKTEIEGKQINSLQKLIQAYKEYGLEVFQTGIF